MVSEDGEVCENSQGSQRSDRGRSRLDTEIQFRDGDPVVSMGGSAEEANLYPSEDDDMSDEELAFESRRNLSDRLDYEEMEHDGRVPDHHDNYRRS